MVAKHGSRSITSKSGSADMFEELGIKLDISIQNSAKLLQESGFCFMFAQNLFYTSCMYCDCSDFGVDFVVGMFSTL